MKVPRFLFFIFAALMFAAGTAFVACNGDDDDNGDATPTAVVDNGNGDDNGNGVVGDGDFEAAAQRTLNATFRVTYNVVGDAFDMENATAVIAKDGTNRFAFWVTGERNGEPASFVIIQTSEFTVLCVQGSDEDGLFFPGGDEGACFESDPDDPTLQTFDDELRDLAQNHEVLGTSSRQIAGRNAECFEIRDLEFGDEQEMCFDSDGVVLYIEDRADGTIFEATDVSTSVSNSDFEPPFPVREFDFDDFDFDDDFDDFDDDF